MPISVYSILEIEDHDIFFKVSNSEGHPKLINNATY